MTEHQLQFVQFPHPKGEHAPDSAGFRGWTLGGHGRKFMASQGTWMSEADPTATRNDDEIRFWGEWEAPSRVITGLEQSQSGQPRFLYEPLWACAPDDPRAQNTDPFVFGDRFLYSNCRQNTKTGPRSTQRLARGSVIAFGSGGMDDFALDTVFVVADSRPITDQTIDELEVDPVFRAVALDLLAPSPGGPTYTLYEGATPDDPVAGMFSFFPCIPSDGDQPGFARPTVELDGRINPRNWRAVKLTPMGDLEIAHRLWESLADQVLAHDLSLGTYAAIADAVPNLRSSRTESRLGRISCVPDAPSC